MLESALRRRSQVVRQRSAKPPSTGSNPVVASSPAPCSLWGEGLCLTLGSYKLYRHCRLRAIAGQETIACFNTYYIVERVRGADLPLLECNIHLTILLVNCNVM